MILLLHGFVFSYVLVGSEVYKLYHFETQVITWTICCYINICCCHGDQAEGGHADMSSDEEGEHDAYLERMKQEARERDEDDDDEEGKLAVSSLTLWTKYLISNEDYLQKSVVDQKLVNWDNAEKVNPWCLKKNKVREFWG